VKTKTIIPFILFIVVITISGCRTYNHFYSDYDKSIDFTKYKTYAWLSSKKPHQSTAYDNDVIENNTKSYIDHEFTDRGYTTDTVAPDILLELVFKNEKEKQVIQNNQPYYNPYNYNNYTYYNYPYNQIYNSNPYFGNPYYNNYPYSNGPYSYYQGYNTTVEYMKGAITINVIDRKANKLVWTGSAEGDIYDPKYLKNAIHPAVIKILKQYPIKPIVK
jgi:Domain of unknown function (DUF4136)